MIKYRLASPGVASILTTLHGIYCAPGGTSVVPHKSVS
jgi:hypothetical protein